MRRLVCRVVAAAAPPLLAAAAALGLTLPAKTASAQDHPIEWAAAAQANVLVFERAGAYTRAADELRALRPHVPRDPDLELWLALYLAREGRLDSARALLEALPLSTADLDSQKAHARVPYHWDRRAAWSNGRFDGWSWYVWRARAEVAASGGRWEEAALAQRKAVEQRPWAGKESVLLGTFLARAGDWSGAAPAFARGRLLDPTLPEAHYLHGLAEWREGRRASAAQAFAQALLLDSLFAEASLGRARTRLPGGGRPDSLPGWLLRGASSVALLTSPAGPKVEEQIEVDQPAAPEVAPQPRLAPADSSVPPRAILPVLVDERGRIALVEPPYMDPRTWPDSLIHRTLAPLKEWRLRPATRSAAAVRAWSEAVLAFEPSPAGEKASP